MPFVIALLSFALGIALPHWLVRWDEGRLSAGLRARGWNTASHWSALVGFSWLAVPVHFARTRRSWRGALLGLIWMLLGSTGQALLIGAWEGAWRWLGE